jgi:hypothetical protein
MTSLAAVKGVFTTDGTGDSQSIGGLGLAPRAVIAWWSRQDGDGVARGNRGGLGFWAVGSGSVAVGWASDDGAAPTRTAHLADTAALLGLDAGADTHSMRADVASFDPDGFTLAWTTRPKTRWIVHFLALGGPALTAAHVGWITSPTSPQRQSVMLDAIRPDLVLFAPTAAEQISVPVGGLSIGIGAAAGTQQAAAGYVSRNGAEAGEVGGGQRSDAAILVVRDMTTFAALGRIVEHGPQDVTIQWSPAGPDPQRVLYLALEGIRCKVGTDISPSAPESRSTKRLGFRPDALLFFTWGLHAKTETTDIGRLCIGGATSPAASGCASWDDRDVDAHPTVTHVCSSTRDVLVVTNTQTGGIHAAASLASIDSGGFSLAWTRSDGLEREFAYVALGGQDGGRLRSALRSRRLRLVTR